MCRTSLRQVSCSPWFAIEQLGSLQKSSNSCEPAPQLSCLALTSFRGPLLPILLALAKSQAAVLQTQSRWRPCPTATASSQWLTVAFIWLDQASGFRLISLHETCLLQPLHKSFACEKLQSERQSHRNDHISQVAHLTAGVFLLVEVLHMQLAIVQRRSRDGIPSSTSICCVSEATISGTLPLKSVAGLRDCRMDELI